MTICQRTRTPGRLPHPAKHEAVRQEVAPLKNPDELRRENEVLRDRLSRLSAAVLRVSASLDLQTVLQEVVESARALTSARYGAITTIDARGQAREFVSSGLTSEEHRQLAEWPDGPRLFEHLRELPVPLRLRDARAYVRSLGFSSDLILPKSMQGTPMRHRGTHVGNFFLGDKEGGEEFTSEDEEVLMLFAAQAATAIANARTYRDEQRARADLEALIDTSPVGVVVFEARSGAAVSINQEARRIVDGLRMPGRSPEELLEVVTCQRADGHEVSLADFPLAQQLVSAETVRAEEIVLSVPDGRRVKTLVNATPIRSADGEVESVVVTMQDLAPLEDLERMRAEFLSMVSHELRAPLAAIKGSAATALGASRRLDAAEVREFFRIIKGQADQMHGLISDLLDAGRIESGTLSVAPEPTDVTALVDQARNTFIGGGGRHAVRMDLPPELPRVMADRQRIVQVLNNLLSNAARHSPASSPIRISATVDGVHVAIPQASRTCRRRAGARGRRLRPGPGHLPGAGRGPRGPHPRRQRRGGPGDADHLHDPCARRQRRHLRMHTSVAWPGACGSSSTKPCAISDHQTQARRDGAAPGRGLPPGDAHRPSLHGSQFGRSPLPLGPRRQQGGDRGRHARLRAG